MKKFKMYSMKSISTTLFLFFIGLSLYAQTPPAGKGPHSKEDREKIIQMKVAYVREHLGLTDVENKRFFPVYEENLRKEEALRKKQRGSMRHVKQNYAQMADADIEKAMLDEMNAEQQLLDFKKVQFEAYKKLIPIKKIVELKITERAFNKMLMEKLRDKRKGTPPPPPPGDK